MSIHGQSQKTLAAIICRVWRDFAIFNFVQVVLLGKQCCSASNAKSEQINFGKLHLASGTLQIK